MFRARGCEQTKPDKGRFVRGHRWETKAREASARKKHARKKNASATLASREATIAQKEAQRV
jgi:hypothetical protein